MPSLGHDRKTNDNARRDCVCQYRLDAERAAGAVRGGMHGYGRLVVFGQRITM